ncbi:glutathione synthase, partial [Buchnera aphidicola]|nr:glutathione synthase [Buchnera aphidicola]
LYLYKGQAYARTRLIKIKKSKTNWYQFIQEKEISLNQLDAILMRKNPPFNMEFIYVTYILEHAEKNGVLIINKPRSLRDCNEKMVISYFSDITPETLVTRNMFKIRLF